MTAFPSPNFTARRGGAVPVLVVLHYTAMPSAAAARARLCAPEHQVSAHWLIGPDGQAEQLVDEAMRAWHAGAGGWAGLDDINSHSIGIELANAGDHPFAARQMTALEQLLRGIMARWPVPPSGVIAHSDLAPGRKSDPGPRFDWRRLALGGLSVWPESVGDPQAPLLPSLARIGYPPAEEEALLAAFRLRFRPHATGPQTAQDRAMADAVANLVAPISPLAPGARLA